MKSLNRYVECTSSAVQAVVLFKKLFPSHRKEEIEAFIEKAIKYIKETQKEDGSWYGNWGICHLYATYFAIKGLVAAGNTYNNCTAMRRGVDFLLKLQCADGGWGESHISCIKKVHTPLQGNTSNLVQTSFALMALIYAQQVSSCFHFITINKLLIFMGYISNQLGIKGVVYMYLINLT